MAKSRTPAPGNQLDLAVIVPCHNEAETLPAQLDALTAQRWDGEWEIIVVDNASSDATAEIARSYSSGELTVRVVEATQGRGVSYSRNEGVRSTDALGVAFCDGDDVVHPGWVAAMGTSVRANRLVTGPVEAETLNEPWLAATRPMASRGSLPHFGAIPFARGGNCAMARSLWEELGGYREDFVGLEDIEFSVRAAATGVEPVLAADALLAYRYRPGLGAVWRQGFVYGHGRPALAGLARGLALEPPRRTVGLRSWGWLALRLPTLFSRSGRHAWTWVLANRVGVVRGSLRRGAGLRYFFA